MKFLSFLLSTAVCIGLISILNKQLTVGKNKTPKLGMFLSPQKGFWKNAESKNISFNENLKLQGLQANGDVYFDERLVPHIYANTNADAYYIQGYLHAKFRLWQMEFQTHIAAGRLSEIRGKDSTALAIDKFFRRLGMVYAAENCVQEMEKDAATKEAVNAYTKGINAYISSLQDNDLPFEYKLMNYKPELWTNLKTALFLKLMSFDLTGREDDITYTNAKHYLGYNEFMKIFPNVQDSLDPILPKGTLFSAPSVKVVEPTSKDSLYLYNESEFTASTTLQPNIDNGSNNWAVDSSKTKSKRAILCNDPHLGLSLPSLWYEMQITTPTYSSYGATFPGSPAIVIGFNNNIAWGVTNAGRDVKDYYQIKFKDDTKQEYWFNNSWKKSTLRKEIIKVKGEQQPVVETIAITEFGVVMYDKDYKSKTQNNNCIAVRWTAHDASNELQTFMKLNAAKDYSEYLNAISTFSCPGQNFVFASKAGDVAITQQGKFVAKWQQQGDYLMPGFDSTYMWQGFIPFSENPHHHNPVRGFVSSANQKAVDETYPYYLGRAGNFPLYRGITINKKLNEMSNITVDDMKQLQCNVYDEFVATAIPILMNNIDEKTLNNDAKKYFQLVKNWNYNQLPNEKAATIFNVWWRNLDSMIFDDDFKKCTKEIPHTLMSALAENLLKDSAYTFIDNRNTAQVETIKDIATQAFLKTATQLSVVEKNGNLDWGKYRGTSVLHPTKMDVLSRLNLYTGGNGNCINACKDSHGPSWKMIVHLTDNIEAYGVYPGGQSGNVGSKYYDNFVDTWAANKYNKLLLISKENAVSNKNFKWHMSMQKG